MATRKWAEIKKLSKATEADRAEARAELEAEIGRPITAGSSDIASDAGWWNDLSATVGMQLERFVDDNLRITFEHEADPIVDP